MKISAIQKFTMLDYPDHVACIVFTPGCNFRCGYCHNPEFVLPEMIKEIRSSFIPSENFFQFLEQRKGKLEGVVITGGEPTLMPDLLEFVQHIKSMGFLVKLDTNGGRPEVLKKLYDQNLLDYVAMDVKTSLEGYPELVGPRLDTKKIQESMEMIKQSAVPYEFRTTVLKELHTEEVLTQMAKMLQGANQYFLQNFRPQKTLDPKYETYHPFEPKELENLQEFFQQTIERVYVR